MKLIRFFVITAALLAAAGLAAFADGFSVQLGATGYDFNALSAAQQATGASKAVSSDLNISPDPFVNGSYSMKLGEGMSLKTGLAAEDMIGTIGFVQIGRIEPYVVFSAGGFSAQASLPLYFLGYDTARDAANKEISYMFDKYYKGPNLSTRYDSTNATFLVTDFLNIAYKLPIDKSLSFTFSASTEIGNVPAFWMYDVKPQVTMAWGPVQLDVKESIYFVNAFNATTAPATTYGIRYYTDPKLAFDFNTFGVKGLKAYFAASLYLVDVDTKGNVTYYGTKPAVGSSITPGLTYSFGPLAADLSFKYSNYDKSAANNGADPTFDPALKLTYTLSF